MGWVRFVLNWVIKNLDGIFHTNNPAHRNFIIWSSAIYEEDITADAIELDDSMVHSIFKNRILIEFTKHNLASNIKWMFDNGEYVSIFSDLNIIDRLS